MNNTESSIVKTIKHSEIKTLEDYILYTKQKSKRWYEANKEKKLQYQKDRYYKIKQQNSENQNQ